MERFDCLSPDCSLLGPHLLEASAGTGKTFAVEQIFVRLLLEKEIEIDQILAVTFTRAATRELKERIRSNIEKAIAQLNSQEIQWEYLTPYCGQTASIRRLRDALNGFDQSQIFTIHGFCHRMLKEFAFEAGLRFSSQSTEPTNVKIPESLKKGVVDFLSYLKSDLICSEQLAILLKSYKSSERLAEALLKRSMKEIVQAPTFGDFYQEYRMLIGSWNLEKAALMRDFQLLEKNYKVAVKGPFLQQIEYLAGEPTEEAFRFLLRGEDTLFEFLAPSNRRVKFTPVIVESQPFFDWGRVHLVPLIERASNSKTIFSALLSGWISCAQRLMDQEELFDPDAILKRMGEALNRSPFVEKIKTRYQAVIVDEFQDTDPVQWEIFRNLFLGASPVKALFFVGDPKQSIYRFRKADIYTYLEAKEHLDPSQHYFLDTNFRSSAPLIGALNALFEREWLSLPKLKKTLPYLPVKAGAKGIETYADGKGAIHFFIGQGDISDRKWPSKPLMDQVFLPFLAKEISRLRSETGSLNRFAILVKDRYQAGQVVQFLQEKGLPALTKSHVPLGETFAFQALKELLESLIDPKSSKKARAVLAGPFSRMKADEIPIEIPPLFYELKSILEEKGLVPFLRIFLEARFHRLSLWEAMASEDLHFIRDFFHAIELLLDWERKEGFSIDGLSRALKNLSLLESEEDEQVRRRMESDDEAIQVMTMHVSKGLEFDVVFALGLATRTPKPEEEPEELEVEKLRQLYVAMTRAKRRLYLPIIVGGKEEGLEGTDSPIELFLRIFRGEKSLEKALEEVAQKSSISWETLSSSEFDEILNSNEHILKEPPLPNLKYTPSYLHSFTSLARKDDSERSTPLPNDQFTIHTLPRGAEMGIVLHELFEDVFSSSQAIWQNQTALSNYILEEIKHSKFAPWKEVIRDLVVETVSLPFLSDLEPQDVRVEVEFIYEQPPHFIKGFVDLVFRRHNKLYFLDWKSNWLGENEDAYAPEYLEKVMKSQDYELQASLYAEALKRAFGNLEFGGAYYIFLRGIRSSNQGVFFFQPRGVHAILA
ncbi:MAG: UvrD-helicase domain-containing protein [Verrucomicrobia bacterium]|nr:UvrD-helicase domain-containing protein [Verrucomicrobiota bacterium]